MADNSIFVATIVPAGYSRVKIGDAFKDTLSFSLVFELNKNHPVYNEKQGTAEYNKLWLDWLKQVSAFPDKIEELRGGSPIHAFFDTDTTGVVVKGGNKQYDIIKAKKFLSKFLGFEFTQAKSLKIRNLDAFKNSQLLVLPPIVAPKLDILYHPVFKKIEMDKIKAKEAEKEKTKVSAVVANTDSVVMLNAFTEIEPLYQDSEIAAINALKTATKAGMADAFKLAKEENNQRFAAAHKSLTTFKNVPMLPVKVGVSASVKYGAQLMSVFEHLSEAIINHPEYVAECFEKLNHSLSVRRYIGTIADFTVEVPSPIASNKSTHLAISIKLNGETGGKDDWSYFDYRNSLDLFTYGLANRVVCSVAPDESHRKFYQHFFLQLKGRCDAISYEPESSYKNQLEASKNLIGVTERVQSMNLTNLRITNAEPLQKLKTQSLKLGSVEGGPRLESVLQDITKLMNKKMFLSIARAYNNHTTNTQTKGLSFYMNDEDWLKLGGNAERDDKKIYDHDLIRGYNVFINRSDDPNYWYCITTIKEIFLGPGETAALAVSDSPIVIDSAVHVLDQPPVGTQDGVPSLKGIRSGFMLNWDGTTVSIKNPISNYDVKQKDQNHAAFVSSFPELVDHHGLENLSVFYNNNQVFQVDHFPHIYADLKSRPEYLLKKAQIFNRERQQEKQKDAIELKFSKSLKYRCILTSSYLNGYAPITEQVINSLDADFLNKFASDARPFLRYDHIKNAIISLQYDIYDSVNRQQLLPDNLGESPADLVIRTYDEGRLGPICSRYILPPPVPNFHIFLWYNRKKFTGLLQDRDLDKKTVRAWKDKYMTTRFDKENGNHAETTPDTNQPAVFDGRLRYLPDPIVTGMVIRFFKDKNCHIIADPDEYPETLLPFEGRYPALKAWTLSLRTDFNEVYNGSNVRIKNGYVCEVYLRPGDRLYARLLPTFDRTEASFADALFHSDEHVGKFSYGGNEYYYNSLYTNETPLSFTHACQKPLIKPYITEVSISRYLSSKSKKQPQSFTANINLHFEHLNLLHGMVLEDIQPTGDLELYAVWEEYGETSREPLKTLHEKLEGGVEKSQFVSRIDFSKKVGRRLPLRVANSMNSMSDYADIISFESESSFTSTQFTRARLIVRNTSSFVQYFTDASIKDGDTKDKYSRWSDPFPIGENSSTLKPVEIKKATDTDAYLIGTAGYLFNNRKPEPPVVRKIIPLIVQDETVTGAERTIIRRAARVQVYFEKTNRNSSGYKEKVAVLLKGSEGSSYPVFLAPWSSQAGRDAVTDTVSNNLDLTGDFLDVTNFHLDSSSIEKSFLDSYIPQSVVGPGNVKMVNYYPEYDDKSELWYVEIELQLQNRTEGQLHSPFIQLYLANYQEWSANYNVVKDPAFEQDTEQGFLHDYRISMPVKINDFCVYPGRDMAVRIIEQARLNSFKITADLSSLFFYDGALRSQFYIALETIGTNFVVNSKIDKILTTAGGTTSMKNYHSDFEKRYHPLLPLKLGYDQTQQFECIVEMNAGLNRSPLRAVIYEVEYYDYNKSLKDVDDLIEQNGVNPGKVNQLRVINIATINLR